MRTYDSEDKVAEFNYKGIKVQLFWDGFTQGGKPRLSFMLHYKGKEIHKGDDLCLGMGTYPDSIEAVTSLLGFLVLQPGDVDTEFFKNHSPEFLALLDTPVFDDLRVYVNDFDSGDKQYEPLAKRFFKRHVTL